MQYLSDLDEIIEFSDYDLSWSIEFEQEKRILAKIFSQNKFEEIQHIGSTSIPGMFAKPIIDIMIGLKELSIDEYTERKLQENGYLGFGEAGVKGRLYYRKRELPPVNLAIVEWKGEVWKNNILIREYLLKNPDEIKNYSDKKKQIRNSGINTLLEYSSKKSEFMMALLKKAEEWFKNNKNNFQQI
jgi:GrpB-like predicted nucleotidyltransferase (UPF0157 family)